MYLSHFRLEKEPFHISPEPEFFWMGVKQAAAFQTLREGLLERDGCVLLTGDIGTGKTVLVKRLMDLKEVAAVFTTVSGPELNGLDFYRLLAADLLIGRRCDSREEFLADFTRFLEQDVFADQKLVIIIDEAQRLNREILQDLVVLSHLQPSAGPGVKLCFVGQLAFDDLLTREENRDVRQSIATRHRLEPLTEEETGSYIVHRLQVAGREQPLFSVDAVHDIHALSKGYPRLINTLCDYALLYGYGANLDRIDSRVITECRPDLSVALDLNDGSPPALSEAPPSASPADDREASQPAQRSWYPWPYIAAAVAAAGLAFYLIAR
jgi:type II secretory pathway predicted ATPase ExeA